MIVQISFEIAGRGPGETRRVSPASLKNGRREPSHPVCRFSCVVRLLHARGHDFMPQLPPVPGWLRRPQLAIPVRQG
jgi:hypothetical protein